MAKTQPQSDQRPDSFSKVNEESIRVRAYQLYEARGREPGHEWDDWLQAEREIDPRREEQ